MLVGQYIRRGPALQHHGSTRRYFVSAPAPWLRALGSTIGRVFRESEVYDERGCITFFVFAREKKNRPAPAEARGRPVKASFETACGFVAEGLQVDHRGGVVSGCSNTCDPPRSA